MNVKYQSQITVTIREQVVTEVSRRGSWGSDNVVSLSRCWLHRLHTHAAAACEHLLRFKKSNKQTHLETRVC